MATNKADKVEGCCKANMGQWRAKKLGTKPSTETGAKRDAKRRRLGNASDRAFYKNVKAPSMDPSRYAALCLRADKLQ